MDDTSMVEGRLEKILKVVTRQLFASNGVFGPGYASWPAGQQHTSVFSISREGGTAEFSYPGVLLPDSIGHKVMIYLDKKKEKSAYKICDIDIDRMYELEG